MFVEKLSEGRALNSVKFKRRYSRRGNFFAGAMSTVLLEIFCYFLSEILKSSFYLIKYLSISSIEM